MGIGKDNIRTSAWDYGIGDPPRDRGVREREGGRDGVMTEGSLINDVSSPVWNGTIRVICRERGSEFSLENVFKSNFSTGQITWDKFRDFIAAVAGSCVLLLCAWIVGNLPRGGHCQIM